MLWCTNQPLKQGHLSNEDTIFWPVMSTIRDRGSTVHAYMYNTYNNKHILQHMHTQTETSTLTHSVWDHTFT